MSINSKEAFIEDMKARIKKFAVDIIKFCETLKASKASDVITFQLIKSSTSVGANYRAACRARSRKEFFSKMCIVVEEVDESQFWLEIIQESQLSNDPKELERLLNEADEISRITGKAKNSTYKSLN